MNFRAIVSGVSLLALGLSTGCYSGPDAFTESGTIVERQIVLNGPENNGLIFNGFMFNGFQFNGFILNGFQFNGFHFNGFLINGSEMIVTVENNGEIIEASSAELLGSELLITTQKVVGGEVTEVETEIRIDDVYPSPKADDVFYHLLSAYDAELDDWVPLCSDGQGNQTEAILLAGGWDNATGARIESDKPTATFACRGDVLAKCVEMGYAPWREAEVKTGKKHGKHGKTKVVTLADHHQACTRMLRADYCGTGEPNTVNGTLIDVADKVEPDPIQAYESKWDYEAEWGPDGAVCIGDSLRTQLFENQDGYEMPSCINDIPETKKCGKLKKTYKTGALLGTRFELPK
ncbi:MAG: hypothetical protein H6713_17040 [Myxococcales bacterium]|nr:hypothetical protein [Myxococcales bacterium]